METDVLSKTNSCHPYKVWVIEILLEASMGSFFALEISRFNERDYLFSSKGSVVLFSRETIIPCLAENLNIDLSGVKIEKLISLKLDIELVFQYLYSKKRKDSDDSILNFLNFSFHFNTITGVKLSKEQLYLEDLADFLTFSKYPKKFLREHRISKDLFVEHLEFLVSTIRANHYLVLNISQMLDFDKRLFDSNFRLGVLMPFLNNNMIDIDDLRG